MDMIDERIDERAASPVGQPFRVCASKTEVEALELTKTNPNILYFSSDTNTIIFNGVMRTNPTPDLNSVLKKTDIIDNTSTDDNTKVLSAKQGKILNDTKLNKTDVIGNLTNSDNTKALAASQGKVLDDKKIDKSEIVDDTSTDDATKPLSARQGKFLSDEITNVENSVQDIYAEIPTKTSELTNDSNYVTTNNVLTKTNTVEYDPVGEYHPATKKYVDHKHTIFTISNEVNQELITNQFVKGEEAENKINLIFQSVENFKAIVTDLVKDTLLFFTVSEFETFKVSVSHVYCNPNSGAYELTFIFLYSGISSADVINILTKRVFIALNSTKSNFFVVQDLIQSDNINTVTKKSKSEYDAINPKNNNTMYAVTE